jgi:hypothetical protein
VCSPHWQHWELAELVEVARTGLLVALGVQHWPQAQHWPGPDWPELLPKTQQKQPLHWQTGLLVALGVADWVGELQALVVAKLRARHWQWALATP